MDDGVLVRKEEIKGKHKLADISEPCTYVVISLPKLDIPFSRYRMKGAQPNQRY